MTKNFKELISEYDIVIPLIQRDYAQGRKSETARANNFLDAILKGTAEGLNFDFIYGKISIDKENKKSFIPLDGQQRLTTLLLIHWYVSLESESKIKYFQKFTYEVRSSTKDFIKKLMSEDSLLEFKKHGIKKSIKNANWFFISWTNDPTVVAILNMLDLIEKKFQKVSINDLDKITFEFLNLNEFKLTDELYVKMNARGKPLTEFENFKSNFEKFLVFEDKEYEHKTKAKLDNEWLNVFWIIAKDKADEISEAPELADEMFYNFFYNMTFNFYLENLQEKKEKINEIKLICSINQTKQEFSSIVDFINSCSIFNFYKEVYKDCNNIIKIITVLNKMINDELFKTFISKQEIFQDTRAKYYAYALGYIYDLDEIEFERWKRVSFNLINNQNIQSPNDLIRAIQSLKNLIQNSNKNIYTYVSNNSSEIQYFSKIQRNEESLKANLILGDDSGSNEQEFIKAEKVSYLNGQIGFLIDYSTSDKIFDIEKFKDYRDTFEALWEVDVDNQILIYQALLTKGNYLPKISSNYTFCSFDSSIRMKSENWRRVFNSDKLETTKDNPERTLYFKHLLDNIDKNDIIISLQNIIQEWLKDKSYCGLEKCEEKYIYTLVSNSNNIQYCDKLQIRYYQNAKEVYLLKTTQMNGTHAELYTYHLYKMEFDGKEFKPFLENKYFSTNSWNLPYIDLSSWLYQGKYEFKIKIYYDSESEKYEIYFCESNEKEFPKLIVNMLEKLYFKSDEKWNYILKTEYSLCQENELFKVINKLHHALI